MASLSLWASIRSNLLRVGILIHESFLNLINEFFDEGNQLIIDNAITLFITDFVGMQPVNSSVSNAQTAGTLTGYGTMGRNLSFRELQIN